MYQFLIILALFGLAGASGVQEYELSKLDDKASSLGSRFVQLESQMAHKEDLVAALYRYTLDNHKNIQRLKRKRVLQIKAFGPEAKEAHVPSVPLPSSVVGVSQDLFDVGWSFGKKVYIKRHGVFTIDVLLPKEMKQTLHLYTPSREAARRFGGDEVEVYLLDLETAPRKLASVE